MSWLAGAEPFLRDYAQILETDGVERGLIGPREAPRLWERHILNCAVVVDPAMGLVANGASVIDVGSGAGLPGLVWAIARPDLRITLLEPLLRRSTFLEETVARLGLTNATVVRGRAEEVKVRAEVVTARAVAPMERLLGWVGGLVAPGGEVLALKGESAAGEIDAARSAGFAGDYEIVRCGEGVIDPLTTVVRVRNLTRTRAR